MADNTLRADWRRVAQMSHILAGNLAGRASPERLVGGKYAERRQVSTRHGSKLSSDNLANLLLSYACSIIYW